MLSEVRASQGACCEQNALVPVEHPDRLVVLADRLGDVNEQLPAVVNEVLRNKALNLVVEHITIKDESGNELDVEAIQRELSGEPPRAESEEADESAETAETETSAETSSSESAEADQGDKKD